MGLIITLVILMTLTISFGWWNITHRDKNHERVVRDYFIRKSIKDFFENYPHATEVLLKICNEVDDMFAFRNYLSIKTEIGIVSYL